MMEPTGAIEDLIKELLASDDEAAREYLKESFLQQAMSALFHARRAAGLTQAQLADRLHTRQSSIARLERDLSGAVTLRRYLEVAMACGVAPLDMTLVPLQALVQFASEDAETPRTQVAFNAWNAGQASLTLTSAPQLVSTVSTQGNVLQPTSAAPLHGNLAPTDAWTTGIWGGGQAA